MQNDVHTDESLINQRLFRNVHYMMVGTSQWYEPLRERRFPVAMYKGCLPKWDY